MAHVQAFDRDSHCNGLFLTDACLRCQSDNKQEECVGESLSDFWNPDSCLWHT